MTIRDFLSKKDLKSFEAQILLREATGFGLNIIIAHPETELSEKQEKLVMEMTEKRKNGIPIEYITGKKNFYRSTFKVCEGVLIPQPDTETLVEEAIGFALKSNKKEYRILDLCCGTGCIGISVANEVKNRFEKLETVFADISSTALTCCKENAKNLMNGLNYELVMSDLFSQFKADRFDLILTNPPYIQSDLIPLLESDVLHEPVTALDGGKNGLEIIERIVKESPSRLKTNGALIMETGYDQGPAVSSLFRSAGLKEVSVIKDLGGRNRVVKGLI